MNETIFTKNAPEAIGPYSQAVKVNNNMLFCSGQIPLDPATGNVISGGVGEQTERVMQNLKAVIEDSGFSMKDVVKTTIYITDMNSFAEVNGVYAKFFSENFPARATVQVAAIPKGSLVEIDAVACK